MSEYITPDLDLLSQTPARKAITHDEREKHIAIMQEVLESCGIKGRVHSMLRGDVVTHYAFQPAQGVLMSDIKPISEDIACALATDNRVLIKHVPYEPTIDIAVPNVQRHPIRMGNLIWGDKFSEGDYAIPWLLGAESLHDLPIVMDLTEMKHVLVTGCPGTGKTALLQSLVLSVVYTCSPNMCQLVLINIQSDDTFKYCEGIPHLAMPVVKNATDLSFALKSIRFEIDKRTNMVSKGLCTDWPYMVVVVDDAEYSMPWMELEYIAKYGAQVGVHLVVAAQTNVEPIVSRSIKQYMPTRMAFRAYAPDDPTASVRMSGAEKLLDYGDMLISGKSYELIRVHTPDIDAAEIKQVMDFVRTQCKEAPLYECAKELMFKYNKPMISFLQRHLGIGYNKAAELMDQLEATGVVSAPDENNRRKVLK